MLSRNMKLATSVAALVAITACSSDTPNPAGIEEVRLAVIAGAAHGGKPMATHMTQEVTHSPGYAGDADGIGSATLTINHGQGQVCWEMEVTDVKLPATAAHIHHAAVGVRGPVVVALTAPDETGRASGCVTGQDKALLRDILTNPSDYYVNVHTSEYPEGAVRGQLSH